MSLDFEKYRNTKPHPLPADKRQKMKAELISQISTGLSVNDFENARDEVDAKLAAVTKEWDSWNDALMIQFFLDCRQELGYGAVLSPSACGYLEKRAFQKVSHPYYNHEQVFKHLVAEWEVVRGLLEHLEGDLIKVSHEPRNLLTGIEKVVIRGREREFPAGSLFKFSAENDGHRAEITLLVTSGEEDVKIHIKRVGESDMQLIQTLHHCNLQHP